ncbi:hypothetical protein L7F22_064260 [Adiantum nelumboides]|nr:hypothetical protein [Adiantum nelumboides]
MTRSNMIFLGGCDGQEEQKKTLVEHGGKGGITKKMLDKAKLLASFRVVIKRGRLYVEPYSACFQTRAFFSIWGLLQLIEFYPGLVPDIDMLFGCEDTPKVHKRTFFYWPQPSPVFRYCSSMKTSDIPFPDWSFWGWPELHIKSWAKESRDIFKENRAINWEQRHPTAFWRGNTDTGGKLRKNLQRCNAAKYSVEIIHQNWNNETNMRSEESRLAHQCKHRYKLYVEGWGWSVSLKYILACDSPVFLLSPNFYDFFSRGLTPMKHYWPIRTNRLCRSIKFASDWGNNNMVEAS